MRTTIRDLMAAGMPGAMAEAAGWTAKYGAAGAGTGQSDGTAITATVTVFTSATHGSADAAVLPVAPTSYADGADICIVINEAGAELSVYPTTDQKIDDGAANAVSAVADNAVAIFFGYYDGTVGHWSKLEA